LSGLLNPNIIQKVKVQFENNCISLLLDSYNQVLKKKSFKELTENDITVLLVGFMRNNPRRYELNISVDREIYIDSSDTYSGAASANKSPRIDLKYTTWKSNAEYEYYIEAKNICENNWKKTSVTTLINALELQKRYIETGIQNFITGRYPNGCIVGYVVEGNPDNIVRKINEILTGATRPKEHLTKTTKGGFSYCYNSTHPGKIMPILNHYFLLFT